MKGIGGNGYMPLKEGHFIEKASTAIKDSELLRETSFSNFYSHEERRGRLLGERV